MTELVVPKRVEPLSDSIDDGSPHLAATDLDLAKGTQALVRRSAGNRVSLSYHSPEFTTNAYTQIHAPYADLSDATTWTSFSLNDESGDHATFQLPWYVAESHDYPVVFGKFVSDLRYISFEVRMQKSTFVQATSTEEFYSSTSGMPFFGTSMSEWISAEWDHGYPAWFGPWVECSGISLPAAPRDILLTPQVRLSQRGLSALGGVAGTYRVYLYELLVFDAWDE